MTKQEITDKVFKILCNKFEIGKNEITEESSFESFGVKFFDVVDVVIDIEDKFKINIPDPTALRFYKITTVIDFIDSVADYVDMTINKKCNPSET